MLLIDEIYKKLLKHFLCINYLGGEKTILERFPGAEKTLTNECILPDGQVLQLTTTHYLSSFFSNLLEIKYWVNNSTALTPVQLSAGCSTRLIGAIVQMHSDNSGLILPWELSQEQIVVVVFKDLHQDDLQIYLSSLERELSIYRFTIEIITGSLGQTMYRLEKLGIPLVIIVGRSEVENSKVTLKLRTCEDKFRCNLSELKQEIHQIKKNYKQELLNRSRKHNSNFLVKTRDWRELIKLISNGKVVLAPWRDELENETRFKSQKYNFSIRCIKEKLAPNTNFKCVFSGQTANCLAYFGRSY
ncbi:prolyl-tRNA synthetase [Mycoplasma ovis str. Michigan]|uniref:proline--tRNA ligase n=1 Tax=Mycoplasma ovis str. Michigan TaxID=1415773 RepID=A0ABN4BN93_9MOLU|nr:prolyl-tRNA synthetase [Mycoplasma ovis str. Michigan]